MGKAYRNFWSLNTDEAVVAGILRDETLKNIEVLMPLNAQMKDIDLILINMRNKKVVKAQIKGSRAFEPKKSEIRKFGEGSAGWFRIKKDAIYKSSADIFVFLVYVLEENERAGRRIILPHTVTIPTENLKALCKKYKKAGKDKMFSFYFWINPTKRKAFEFRDTIYDLSKYLDKKGFKKLNKVLK